MPLINNKEYAGFQCDNCGFVFYYEQEILGITKAVFCIKCKKRFQI